MRNTFIILASLCISLSFYIVPFVVDKYVLHHTNRPCTINTCTYNNQIASGIVRIRDSYQDSWPAHLFNHIDLATHRATQNQPKPFRYYFSSLLFLASTTGLFSGLCFGVFYLLKKGKSDTLA